MPDERHCKGPATHLWEDGKCTECTAIAEDFYGSDDRLLGGIGIKCPQCDTTLTADFTCLRCTPRTPKVGIPIVAIDLPVGTVPIAPPFRPAIVVTGVEEPTLVMSVQHMEELGLDVPQARHWFMSASATSGVWFVPHPDGGHLTGVIREVKIGDETIPLDPPRVVTTDPNADVYEDSVIDSGEDGLFVPTGLVVADDTLDEPLIEAVDVICARVINALTDHNVEARAELVIGIVSAVLNAPINADFVTGVKVEAMHQRKRWGTEHDAGKTPADWFWLLGHLAGKALAAAAKGDKEKAKHHTISSAAVLLNWHAHLTGADTAMRPGIDDPD